MCSSCPGLLGSAQRAASLVGGEAEGRAGVVERCDVGEEVAAGELELGPASAEVVECGEQSDGRAGEGGDDDAGAVGDLSEGLFGGDEAGAAGKRAQG